MDDVSTEQKWEVAMRNTLLLAKDKPAPVVAAECRQWTWIFSGTGALSTGVAFYLAYFHDNQAFLALLSWVIASGSLMLALMHSLVKDSHSPLSSAQLAAADDLAAKCPWAQDVRHTVRQANRTEVVQDLATMQEMLELWNVRTQRLELKKKLSSVTFVDPVA